MVNHQHTDIIAFETIPCLTEVRALIKLLQTRPEAKAWISVSTNSETTLCSGELLTEFARLVEFSDQYNQVEAIGVNCSDPKLTAKQIELLRGVTQKTLIFYPNNGDVWDGQKMEWVKLGEESQPTLWSE